MPLTLCYNKIKNDPYADLGSNVATIDKRSDMELHTNTESNSEETVKFMLFVKFPGELHVNKFWASFEARQIRI